MRTADDFEGAWQLDRTIDDRYGKMVGTFTGRAVFRSDDAGRLIYHETGQMTYGASGGVMAAERKYLWHFGPRDVTVFFDDESPFHSFVPHGQAQGTAHPCGDDLYNVTYDFRTWPVWRAEWSVVGPRKDYTSVSRYHKG